MQSTYTIEVRNRFQPLANVQDPFKHYEQFIKANELAAQSCVPKKEKTRKPMRSMHPDVTSARERLNGALEVPSDTQEINEARSPLFSVYDRLLADDIEEKVQLVERAHQSSQYGEARGIVNQINGRKKSAIGRIVVHVLKNGSTSGTTTLRAC